MDNLCLLIEVFRPLTFNVAIDRVAFKFVIILFAFYVISIFCFSFSAYFGLNKF